MEITAKFDVTDGKLTGTVTGIGGDTPIAQGTVKGDAIAFALPVPGNDKAFVRFTGTIEGDTIPHAKPIGFPSEAGIAKTSMISAARV